MVREKQLVHLFISYTFNATFALYDQLSKSRVWSVCVVERYRRLADRALLGSLSFQNSRFQNILASISVLWIPALYIFTMTKGIVAEERRKGNSVADEKGKISNFRTRVRMDFDPKPTILSSQKGLRLLDELSGCLPLMITVEFCPATMDVKVPPPIGGMYFHVF